MLAMLPWFRAHPDQADVRVVTKPDVGELLHAVRRAENAHIHADWWPLDHYLALGRTLVATHRGGIVGVLACPSDPPPAAWIRAWSIANGWQVRPLAERLLSEALAVLAAAGVGELGLMHAEPWLTRLLPDLGMHVFTEVITWRSHDLSAADAGNPQTPADLRVRAARPEDLPALAQAESEAFDPLWRLSEATLERMLSVASSFTVAELDGAPVAYQFSSLYNDYGHLVRITVRPGLQGRGIGSALISNLFRYSAARGITTMTLNTQQHNRSAQRVYMRFGFRVTHESIPVWRREISAAVR